MKLLLPLAGQSSRFPRLRPKWMLTHPNGNLMVAESISGIDLSSVDEILPICLEKHELEFGVVEVLHRQFKKLGLPKRLSPVVITDSSSQPHTVYQCIRDRSLTGPILIKDCDNYFRCTPIEGNCIGFSRLSESGRITAGNKSYINLTDKGVVLNIVEKRVLSDTFCCGIYGFKKAEEFAATFEKLQGIHSLFISHIIYQMILDGKSFTGMPVSNYQDWGTLDEWNEYRQRFCALFIDLDGVLVENSAEYFAPHWGETEAIRENVSAVNKLYDQGSQIFIVTSRSKEAESRTISQLERIGLKYNQIIFGVLHAKRIIVNDYTASNPYPSCDAINIARNSPRLEDLLSGCTNASHEKSNAS